MQTISFNKIKKQNFLTWKIDKKIFKTGDYKLNEKIAAQNADKSLKIIAKKYTHILPKDMESFLKFNKKIWSNIKGFGADLGGGVGILSSVIAKKKNLKKIYCIEISKNAVTKCQPNVKKKLLKKKRDKVVSVLGNFDNIELKKSSLDFCIAWDAMHHSHNLVKTLKGVKRVLKKNGKLIIIDRVQNNSTTNAEIRRMENIAYPRDFLKANSLPLNKIFTRKMNGEREYRFKDWEKFFKKAGFKISETIMLKERHEKVIKKKNDNKIREKIVNFEIGGFERQKIIYMISKN